MPTLTHFSSFYNWLQQKNLVKKLQKQLFGMVDAPLFASNWRDYGQNLGAVLLKKRFI